MPPNAGRCTIYWCFSCSAFFSYSPCTRSRAWASSWAGLARKRRERSPKLPELRPSTRSDRTLGREVNTAVLSVNDAHRRWAETVSRDLPISPRRRVRGQCRACSVLYFTSCHHYVHPRETQTQVASLTQFASQNQVPLHCRLKFPIIFGDFYNAPYSSGVASCVWS